MGKTIEQRALEWLLSSNDTGVSSETLCAHMLGLKRSWQSPPSDGADRGRCVRLLKKIPEWQSRLDELAENEPHQNGLVIDRSGIHNDTNTWAKQIPLIKQELREVKD